MRKKLLKFPGYFLDVAEYFSIFPRRRHMDDVLLDSQSLFL